MDFEKELAILINKYSKENESDTPDFILARYLKDCLANYTETVRALDTAIRKECADKAVACFFSTMAESGLSTGNDYAVLVISDKLRAAIESRP